VDGAREYLARPRAAGATACAALARSAGLARVMARSDGSAFLTAGGEILWLGPLTAPLHPRTILVAEAPVAGVGATLRLDLAGVTPWRPAPLALDAAGVATLRECWNRVSGAPQRFGAPAGFGALLLGQTPAFPLTEAGDRAHALARACARDDATEAETVALTLLGLGTGLTPSGDDLVGGALFARHLLGGAGAAGAGAWRRAARAIRGAAAARTHPISAALLADLAGGGGHAPLHDLVAALAADDDTRARDAAGRLARLGHSSGWDILTGFAAGLGALPARRRDDGQPAIC
jgi:hypothetical protein